MKVYLVELNRMLFCGEVLSRPERHLNYTYKEHTGGLRKHPCPSPNDH